MNKGALVFLVIILTAFPGAWAEAEGFDGWTVAPSLSYARDFNFHAQTADDATDMLFGIGLNVPFPFNSKKTGGGDDQFSTEISLIVAPEISVEYGFSSGLLRIRTGAHFGRLHFSLVSLGYYIGLSGVFIKDFANDAFAAAISPAMVFEFYVVIVGFRLQAQYDFSTAERYNRFVFTTSITAIIPIGL